MAISFEETRIKSWDEAKQRLKDWAVAMGYNKEGIISGSTINPKIAEQLPPWLAKGINLFAPQEFAEIIPIPPANTATKIGGIGIRSVATLKNADKLYNSVIKKGEEVMNGILSEDGIKAASGKLMPFENLALRSREAYLTKGGSRVVTNWNTKIENLKMSYIKKVVLAAGTRIKNPKFLLGMMISAVGLGSAAAGFAAWNVGTKYWGTGESSMGYSMAHSIYTKIGDNDKADDIAQGMGEIQTDLKNLEFSDFYLGVPKGSIAEVEGSMKIVEANQAQAEFRAKQIEQRNRILGTPAGEEVSEKLLETPEEQVFRLDQELRKKGEVERMAGLPEDFAKYSTAKQAQIAAGRFGSAKDAGDTTVAQVARARESKEKEKERQKALAIERLKRPATKGSVSQARGTGRGRTTSKLRFGL